MYDLEALREKQVLEGHSAGVKSGLFLPCGTKAVSGGEDKMLRVWDLKAGKEISSVPVQKEITSMELGYSGKVLTFTSGTQAHFWCTETLQMIKSLDCPIINPTLGGNTKVQDITSASLAPDGKKFVAGGPADQACTRASVLVIIRY